MASRGTTACRRTLRTRFRNGHAGPAHVDATSPQQLRGIRASLNRGPHGAGRSVSCEWASRSAGRSSHSGVLSCWPRGLPDMLALDAREPPQSSQRSQGSQRSPRPEWAEKHERHQWPHGPSRPGAWSSQGSPSAWGRFRAPAGSAISGTLRVDDREGIGTCGSRRAWHWSKARAARS